ncbi:hypothetical protein WBG78_29615 [Chryseolinea sp. T2]|uniref:hypothetical protein n=1 Tax=Chryseolinea sp. T2 TaxID=3129255 RepID=UPI003076EF49
MKSNLKLNGRIAMLVAGVALAAAGVANLSFTYATLPGKFWSQLGISEARGTENIRKSFIEGYVYTYGASAAKKIATGDRVAVANDAMAYAKSYVTTPEFQDAYKQAREQQKPAAPAPARTKEEIQAAQIATIEKSIADTEKSMKGLSAEMQESMKDVIKMFNEQLQDYKNPESEMLNYMAEGEKFNHQTAMQTYETNLATWQKTYPENYQSMIKTRLETFLAVTADVDYNAAVHDAYGLKKFNNPAYEKKSDEWKMAYRAGKPVVDAAREFATVWLKELK